MENVKAVVLDIDGTLSPEISWLALTRDLGESVATHVSIYEEYKAGKIGYEESKTRLIALWNSTGNANFSFFHDLFENLPLADNAVSVTDTLKAKYDICLITGSMDMYAEIVAHKLGVTKWFANTKLHWVGGSLTDMDYELNQSARKLEQFLGFCTTNGYQPQECIVVGDSENDMALFEASQRGILVSSDATNVLSQHVWKQIPALGNLLEVIAGTV